MLSLKAKVTLERFAKAIQTNIEWSRQERQKALENSRSDTSVQKSVFEGHVEALTEIEQRLSTAGVKTNQLVARRDATIDEAMAIVVELKNEFNECKIEMDKIYQLDMNNWRVLGKSEMYQKVVASIGQLLSELKSANAS